MDEKMEKAFQELFDKLTDEQLEKAKECKTMDELMDFAGKEGIELPDEFLDSVAGGRLSENITKYLKLYRSPSGGLLL